MRRVPAPDVFVRVQVNDAKGKPVNLDVWLGEWIVMFVMYDLAFAQSATGLFAGEHIRAAVTAWSPRFAAWRKDKGKRKGAAPPLPLESLDWEVLQTAVASPRPVSGKGFYPLTPAGANVHFVRAILDAKET